MLEKYKLRELLKNKYVPLYLAAFAFYYLVWGVYGYHLQPDSGMYLEMGRGIFEQFTFGFKGEEGLYYPVASRTPITSFLLGLFYFVTKDTHLTYFFYSLFQVLLAPIIPCIAFYFGSQLNKKVAYGAYIFIILHANVLASFIMILADTLFAVLSGLTFVSLWMALQKQETKKFLLTGLLAGLAFMTKPVMKLYFLVVVLLSLARFSRWNPLLKCFGLFMLGCGLIIAPWVVRNFIHYKAFVLETNQGMNMLWTNWDLVKIKETDPEEIRILKRSVLDHGGSPNDMLTYKGWQYWLEHDYKISKELQKIAVETYAAHPAEVFYRWSKNFLRVTHSQRSYYYLYESILSRPLYVRIRSLNLLWPQDFDRRVFHLYCEVLRLVNWCYLYVAVVGLVVLLWRERKMGIFIAMNILYFTGLTAFVAGYDRYRLNVEVLYAVLIIYPIVYFVTMIITGIRRYIIKRPLGNESEPRNSCT
jgi:4-amino-4-deoxy-L-arabinose transferase-like glycosyltransferase